MRNVLYALTDKKDILIDVSEKQSKLMQNIIFTAKYNKSYKIYICNDTYGRLITIHYITKHYDLFKYISYEKNH